MQRYLFIKQIIDRSIVLHLPNCLRSVKWIFFIDLVFEIKSCRLGRGLLARWVGGRLVGGSVSKWSVVGWSVGRWSVDLIKFEQLHISAKTAEIKLLKFLQLMIYEWLLSCQLQCIRPKPHVKALFLEKSLI